MNDCVAEAEILEKYKGLVFWDPDAEANFTVYKENLEFHRGKDGGWHFIGNSSDESVEDEGFAIGDMIIGMIANMEQRSGVDIFVKKRWSWRRLQQMYGQIRMSRRKQPLALRCVRDSSNLTAIRETYGIKYTIGLKVRRFYT